MSSSHQKLSHQKSCRNSLSFLLTSLVKSTGLRLSNKNFLTSPVHGGTGTFETFDDYLNEEELERVLNEKKKGRDIEEIKARNQGPQKQAFHQFLTYFKDSTTNEPAKIFFDNGHRIYHKAFASRNSSTHVTQHPALSREIKESDQDGSIPSKILKEEDKYASIEEIIPDIMEWLKSPYDKMQISLFVGDMPKLERIQWKSVTEDSRCII